MFWNPTNDRVLKYGAFVNKFLELAFAALFTILFRKDYSFDMY